MFMNNEPVRPAFLEIFYRSLGSAPTSGGKTLVAELLLLRALLKHDGTMALLVVPYVALALEKRDYLRDVWSPLQVCSILQGQGRK